VADNIAQLSPLLAEATHAGAQLVATPENTFYMRREGTAAMQDVPMRAHPGIVFAQSAAKTHGIWLLIGSIRAREEGSGKPYN
ncbi:hypothetical protein ACO1MN_16095, partial [Staphylococcus aureus]